MTKRASEPVVGHSKAIPATSATPALRSFPAIAIDQAAYRQELAANLHDPFARALVELFWHGTGDYQRFIGRDGFAAQQALLAQIRRSRTHYAGLASDLKPITSMSVTSMVAAGLEHDGAVALKKIHANAVQQSDVLAKADERLTVALMHWLERNGDAPQSTAPVINLNPVINVEPTPITLEAAINVQPAEVAVTLPARLTTTFIERNAAGEIVSAEAIEKSI